MAEQSKPFWKSKTQQGIAIAAISMVAKNLGYDVEVSELEAVSLGLTEVVGAGGLLYAAVGRVLAKVGLTL